MSTGACSESRPAAAGMKTPTGSEANGAGGSRCGGLFSISQVRKMSSVVNVVIHCPTQFDLAFQRDGRRYPSPFQCSPNGVAVLQFCDPGLGKSQHFRQHVTIVLPQQRGRFADMNIVI